MPLASDASGSGMQDYRQVAGRATAVAIDPADPSGNTVYIGGAQSGVWKSTNATAAANAVTWTPLSDDQATLSIGAIAIQPGNSDPAKSVILAATGEGNNSADSYFGMGILRSANGGNTWSLISTANGGALSFSGLGGARMAFSTASGQTSSVVAAMATSPVGLVDGAVSADTARGLYTSLNAGVSWTYNALVDPGGAIDGTSATSVVYNAAAGQFFAAVRYHGFYASPDGTYWTRLAVQPGGGLLGAAACPPQSTSNDRACPIYRAEMSVVPGRNEMYAWFIYFAESGETVDGGIWQSLNAGASWSAISTASIANCGDVEGCGVEQGAYNLELLAVPNAAGTDLYAGAINLYKCSINSQNATCAAHPFMNLTHVYGCIPVAAPAHVHPNQHAVDFMIPASGSDSGSALIYFANDGGIYRALDGYGGLASGACSGANQFDDLNQKLGSMTQFVGFSGHPTDPKIMLGGAQGNGSPATSQATASKTWLNVLGGDGGYTAIDPNAPSNFYASNPDVPPGGLGIQLCTLGVDCITGSFNFVMTSSDVGGDDGGFYVPYILDPQSGSALLAGTCRVWRGLRAGGTYVALSPNFDTLGSGTCSGREVNQIRALAAGGPTDSYGSQVIYATTSGLGPLNGPAYMPSGGRVWVTKDATAGSSAFADVTNNGPQGNINPKQFPISGVAIDSSDPLGTTAYVTVGGFTGAAGHVWKTTNAGAAWTDFTGNLPDAPVNTVIIDSGAGLIYVGSDVGVFVSSTSSAGWAEMGPANGQTGFLPNAAVTALGLFKSGGQQLLRASTYGRGIWQFALGATADFDISISNSPMTVFTGETGIFSGTVTSENGYGSLVTLGCVAGTTAAPATCSPAPASLTPGTDTPFTVTASDNPGDFNFSVQAVGADAKHTTHNVPVTLHVVGYAVTKPSPATVTVARGATSAPVTFQITAAGSFDQTVTVSCTTPITNAICTLTPGTTVNPTASIPVRMTASVTVPVTTSAGNYVVTLQATTADAAPATTTFTVKVTSNPDFVLSEPSAFPEVKAGSSGTTGPVVIASQDGFSGTVALSCSTTFGEGSCSVSPASVNSFPATANLTINGSSFAPGSYSLSVFGTSGTLSHSIPIAFNVGDYSVSGAHALSLSPGGKGTAHLTLASSFFYAGSINASCDASALAGGLCTLSPGNPISLASGGTANLSVSVSVPNNVLPGSYDMRVVTGDASGAPSHAHTLVVTIGQDFLVVSSTASQTVTAGQTTGPYNLTIQPLGAAFNAEVTLSCAGLPAYTQCRFNPATAVTPGENTVAIVMTISTTAATTASSSFPASPVFALWLMGPGLVLAWAAGSQESRCGWRSLGFACVVFAMLLMLPSCSGVSNSGGGRGGHPGTPPGTYKIIVTGASPGAPADSGQSVQVTLVVN